MAGPLGLTRRVVNAGKYGEVADSESESEVLSCRVHPSHVHIFLISLRLDSDCLTRSEFYLQAYSRLE
jgi:hypothetical protein